MLYLSKISNNASVSLEGASSMVKAITGWSVGLYQKTRGNNRRTIFIKYLNWNKTEEDVKSAMNDATAVTVNEETATSINTPGVC